MIVPLNEIKIEWPNNLEILRISWTLQRTEGAEVLALEQDSTKVFYNHYSQHAQNILLHNTPHNAQQNQRLSSARAGGVRRGHQASAILCQKVTENDITYYKRTGLE